MVYHLAAAAENVDQTINPITWIPDDVLGISAAQDNLLVGDRLRYVAGCIFGAPTIDSARIFAESLIKVYSAGGPDFSPLNVGAEPLSPLPWHDFRRDPLELKANDNLQARIANSGAAAGEDAWALLALSDGPIQPATNLPWRTFKFATAASAMTAERWNNRSLTSEQNLSGEYICGGGYAVTTSGRAARLVFRGQQERPGFIIGDTESDVLSPEIFRRGGMGILGKFNALQLPSVDFFVDAADNEVQEVYLDLVPTKVA